MNRRKIAKLRRTLANMRAGVANVKWNALKRFAGSVGRKEVNQGDEPTYKSIYLPQSKPLSIPGHTKLNKFVVGNILDLLEKDLDSIEEILENIDLMEIKK